MNQNTVTPSTRTVPILLSSVLALFLIGGAYLLSGPNPFFTTRVDAKSAEELLRAYAAKDTDADGLPDWQEALYSTDPENPNSFSAEVTDGEAQVQGLLTPKSLASQVPEDGGTISGLDVADDSLTARFSREFFARYFSTRGNAPPSSEEVLAFVNDAVAGLAAERLRVDAFTVNDLELSPDTGAGALANYAALVEEALSQNSVPAEKTDLEYFADAVEKGDMGSLAKLADISGGYEAVAGALMAVPAPEEVALAHLELANALARLGIATGDLAALESDPIRTLLGIGGYQQYELGYRQALARVYGAFLKAGVAIEAGRPGHEFFSAAQAAATEIEQNAL
ncbi:MAG TPA: hypothetical protein VFY28_01050 [Candidatus Paceibacterota bacterium]|nr:hypothetical protein [Candidatus Paceibacterota bacterium]